MACVPNLNVLLSLVVAVNDDSVLQRNLLRSPSLRERCEVIVKNFYPSAPIAYNEGLEAASSDVVIFAHSDIYFPSTWFDELDRALNQISTVDPNWAVLGVFGISSSGKPSGFVYSAGLQKLLGTRFERPIEATSLDEMVLVLRRSSGVRFDPALPGFHLYGTDICLEAQRLGLKSYIFDGLCIHNSNGLVALPLSFWRAYLHLRWKWQSKLPILTCCTKITTLCIPVARGILRSLLSCVRSKAVGRRCADVEALYSRLMTAAPSAPSTLL